MNILAIGDIVGNSGVNKLKSELQDIKNKHNIDFVIVNGENAAEGMGLTIKNFKDINISSSKNSLFSTQKLEKKIKDLELKLDDLNNNISPFLGLTEIEEQEQNKNDKYSILDNPGLSDITKAYLSSYLEDSSPKLELSDFSRAYFFGLDDYNIYNERPALSGLTQEFLMENDNDMDKNEEIKEIKEEGKI